MKHTTIKYIFLAICIVFSMMAGAWLWSSVFAPDTFAARYKAQLEETNRLRASLKNANTTIKTWERVWRIVQQADKTAISNNLQITQDFDEIEQTRISADYRTNLVALRDSARANANRQRFNYSISTHPD